MALLGCKREMREVISFVFKDFVLRSRSLGLVSLLAFACLFLSQLQSLQSALLAGGWPQRFAMSLGDRAIGQRGVGSLDLSCSRVNLAECLA